MCSSSLSGVSRASESPPRPARTRSPPLPCRGGGYPQIRSPLGASPDSTGTIGTGRRKRELPLRSASMVMAPPAELLVPHGRKEHCSRDFQDGHDRGEELEPPSTETGGTCPRGSRDLLPSPLMALPPQAGTRALVQPSASSLGQQAVFFGPTLLSTSLLSLIASACPSRVTRAKAKKSTIELDR